MSSLAFRTRSTGELLDAAFLFFRRHFLPIVLGTSIFAVPAIALDLVLPASAAPVVRILANLLYLTASAVVVLIVSDAYVGNEIELRSILRTVFGRFGSIWGAAIYQGLLVAVGLLLLIVPGLIFFAWTFAMEAAVVIEGCRAGEAFTRSRELSRGEVGRVLGTIVLAYVIVFAAVIGAGMVVGGVGRLLGVAGPVTEALGELVSQCIFPYVGVVTTLLYYDLRIRKEALDLELLTEELADSAAGRATEAVSPA